MADQFPSRLEPLMSLIDLYNQTKSYQQVINTLNRLEELDGKSERNQYGKIPYVSAVG
mgnify:CR=1 FL=1